MKQLSILFLTFLYCTIQTNCMLGMDTLANDLCDFDSFIALDNDDVCEDFTSQSLSTMDKNEEEENGNEQPCIQKFNKQIILEKKLLIQEYNNNVQELTKSEVAILNNTLRQYEKEALEPISFHYTLEDALAYYMEDDTSFKISPACLIKKASCITASNATSCETLTPANSALLTPLYDEYKTKYINSNLQLKSLKRPMWTTLETENKSNSKPPLHKKTS